MQVVGAPDGVGSCLKRIVDMIIAQGKDMGSFQQFVNTLWEKVRDVEIILVHEHEIESMKNILPSKIPSFKGTYKIYQVEFMKEHHNSVEGLRNCVRRETLREWLSRLNGKKRLVSRCNGTIAVP